MGHTKKILKSIRSYEKQIKKHEEKIAGGARKDTTASYWKEEIKRFEREIEKKKRKLKRE